MGAARNPFQLNNGEGQIFCKADLFSCIGIFVELPSCRFQHRRRERSGRVVGDKLAEKCNASPYHFGSGVRDKG